MDDQMTVQAYVAPRIVDYGDLQELTAACLGGTGGDAFDPSGQAGGYTVGVSNPAGTAQCKSKP